MIDLLPARIKEIRKSLKLSQTEMAEKIGIHVQTLSKYERGEQTPSAETIVAIADGLGVNLIWLLNGEGEMLRTPSELSIRIRGIRETFKLSLTEMAKKIDVNPETLNDYEKGINDPADEIINAIIDRFDISPAWILFGEGEMKKPLKDHTQRRAAPIIERLKFALKLKKDEQLENELQLPQGKIVSMVNRYNEIPYDRIATLCNKRGLSFDWILTGEGAMLLSQRTKSSSVDLAFLKEIIEAIEKVFQKENLHLNPKKKAELITLLYDELREEPDKKSLLKGKVIKLVRLAS